MQPLRSSIVARTRMVILIASVLVILATASAFSVYEVASFKGQLFRHLSTVATVIADNSTFSLGLQQQWSEEDVLSALEAEPDIQVAALYDNHGAIFATYPKNASRAQFPAAPAYRSGHFFEADSLVLFVPVDQDQIPLGTLYLRCSLRGLYGQFRYYAEIVAVVLAGSFLMAFFLSGLLHRQISAPILALTHAAKAVAEHEDFTIRAPQLTDDELGTLTQAFNRMLAETQEHQERLGEQARLLNLSTDAIYVRDLQGKILYWNRGAEQLYGWDRSEALGRNAFELLRTEFSAPLESIRAEFHERGRWSGDLVQTNCSGQRLQVSARWVLDRGASHEPKSVLVTDTDITLRKEAEDLVRNEAQRLDQLVAARTAKLQETVGELEAFSYSISHDMRAPLRAMQGYAKALQSDYGPKLDADANHFLDRIARAADRLDSLIQDVLAYSRVSKGEIQLIPIDLERLIREVLQHYPEFQPPKAQIIIQSPLLPVLGHEAYLTQCITNLIGNAVKFVPDNVRPQVRIRSEMLGGKVRLWVEDNGIGIDAAHLERIFEIFGQVHPPKKFGGTGIGLAIVRKAAQRMGGEAGVQSELGKGSQFWISLNAQSA